MEIEVQDIHLENKVYLEQQMKNDMAEVQDGVKDVDVMFLFKNTIYICADNVSEKSQIP
jgi:hypothetical protein